MSTSAKSKFEIELAITAGLELLFIVDLKSDGQCACARCRYPTHDEPYWDDDPDIQADMRKLDWAVLDMRRDFFNRTAAGLVR